MQEIDFPEGAKKEEREIAWRKIAEVCDSDLGFLDVTKEKSGVVGFRARVLLENDKGEICVVKSEKYGYMQIPGGGIEESESIEEALRRETEEETGWLIKDVEPMGYVLERREGVRNKHSWGRAVTFVYRAAPERQVGTKYMEDEIAEGFRPIWILPEDFVAEQEKNEGKIESYSGCFSNRRDLLIAKDFLKR